MFKNTSVAPRLLPKQLSLTYDDGPGGNTLEIAQFLHEQRIRATFFVVGKHVVQHRDVIAKVKSLGHHIGSHTNTHPRLTSVTKEQRIEELVTTDGLIKDLVDMPFLFRAPFGDWSDEVACDLNSVAELRKYVGPIGWHIDGVDWSITNGTSSLEECETRYLQIIHKQQSGVVLLHDSSADPGDKGEQLRRNNRTLELTMRLVNKLRDDGYVFRPLDRIINLRERMKSGRS